MRFKPAFKYQLLDTRKPIIIFYFVMLMIYILITISAKVSYSYGMIHSSSGLEAATIVFLFILGLNSYKSSFHMMMANGVSRKTMFLSFIIMAAVISMGMALIDSLLAIILQQFVNYKTIVEITYDYFLADSIAIGPIWQFANNLCAIMTGYFITTLFYRMNKAAKLLVSIGVPVFFLIVFPIIDSYLFSGVIYRAIGSIFSYISGIKTGSVLINICFNLIFSAVWAGLAYITLRRAPVKA